MKPLCVLAILSIASVGHAQDWATTPRAATTVQTRSALLTPAEAARRADALRLRLPSIGGSLAMTATGLGFGTAMAAMAGLYGSLDQLGCEGCDRSRPTRAAIATSVLAFVAGISGLLMLVYRVSKRRRLRRRIQRLLEFATPRLQVGSS
ncbi:MAG: hypothetical protein AAGE52_26090 [Myxococcota bacterium]